MKVKERNEAAVSVLKSECQSLVEENNKMKSEVKAAKRQNKLLTVALNKAEEHEKSL